MKKIFTHVGNLLWIDASGKQHVFKCKLIKRFFCTWVNEHGLMFSCLSGRSLASTELYLDISSIKPME